jgi:hypothetical protein
MHSIEPAIAMARVLAAMAARMSAEQRANAAAAIRELEGDEAEREFFATAARSLEQLNARTEGDA